MCFGLISMFLLFCQWSIVSQAWNLVSTRHHAHTMLGYTKHIDTINEKTAVYKLRTHGDSSYKVQEVITRPEKTSNNNKEISLEKIASQD